MWGTGRIVVNPLFYFVSVLIDVVIDVINETKSCFIRK